MGGSIGSSLFTAQELSSFEKVKALQAIALRFVSQNLFYGIPVRSGKKAPHDPIGMIWIEPLPEVLENPSSMDVTEVSLISYSSSRADLFMYIIILFTFCTPRIYYMVYRQELQWILKEEFGSYLLTTM